MVVHVDEGEYNLRCWIFQPFYTNMKAQFTTFDYANINKIYYFAFDLKVQVIANSATVSPSLFFPVDLMVAVVALPEDNASLTSWVTSFPSSQVKVVVPFAFFIKFPSTFSTSILTAGSCL